MYRFAACPCPSYPLLAALSFLLLCWGPALSVAATDPPKAMPEVQTLLDAGRHAFLTNQNNQAAMLYEQALAKARELKDAKGEVEALRGQGNVYSSTHQTQQALDCYHQSATLAHTVGDMQAEAFAFSGIGSVYTDLGQMQSALEAYQQELQIDRAVGDRALEAEIQIDVGLVYAGNGQPQKALEYYQQARSLAQSIGDKHEEAHALVNIGFVNLNIDRIQQAMEAYQQLLPLSITLHDREFEVDALSNIGNSYYFINQPQRALEYYQRALPIHRELGFKGGEGGMLVNIGVAYAAIGQTQSALDSYLQALPILRAAGVRQFEANALSDLGNLYMSTGQPQQALTYYKQALLLRQALNDKNEEGLALMDLGYVYLNTGRPQQAIEYFQQALTAVKANYFHQALPYANAGNHKSSQASVLKYMAEAEEKLHNLSSASLHYEQAVALAEQQRNDLGGFSEAKSHFLQAQLPLYYAALRNALTLHHDTTAFALAQKTKARVLLDLMTGGRVDLSHDLTQEERQQEQELRDQADFLNRQMVREGVVNAVGAQQRWVLLQQQLKQTEDRLQNLIDALYARHPALAAKRVARTASMQQVGEALPDDTALLEYVITSSRQVTLFVVRHNKSRSALHVFLLPLDYGLLAQEAASFRAACADPRRPFQTLGRSLYRTLLAPATAALQGVKRLVICPDQALWDIPFAALLIDHSTTLLAERFEIAYAYSATSLLAARSLRSLPHHSPAGSLLILANPEFGDVGRLGGLKDLSGQNPFEISSRPFDAPSRPFDAPSRQFMPSTHTLPALVQGDHIASLPGTRAEARALRSLFPTAVIYTGMQAQEETVKRDGGNYRYLHFATHSFCNDAVPMLSSIVLAIPFKGSRDDGFLTARELSELNLNAELVTLSACNTARGEERSGEGVIGLSWALLVAGCPTQVVSQWSVSDASTATLMAHFYRGLKAGKGKAASLRQAELTLLHGRDARYSHPYYWAPFVLIGDWR
jgi:CHAT domain-containing protein/uncharacterized protein HemY